MNRDIESAIRNALERGHKFEDVKRSLINAGYSKKDVDETSAQIGQGSTSIIYPSSALPLSPKMEYKRESAPKQNVPSASVINSPNEPAKPFATKPVNTYSPPPQQQISSTNRDFKFLNSQAVSTQTVPRPQQVVPNQKIPNNMQPMNSFDNIPQAPRPSPLPTQYPPRQSNQLPHGEIFPERFGAMPKKSNLVILLVILLILLSAAILGVIFREQVISFFDDLLSPTA